MGLLFNHNGKNADFIGERVSDVRIQKGQQNVHDKVLSKEEKQDNVIVIVQIPLKKRVIQRTRFSSSSNYNFYPTPVSAFGGGGGGGNYYSQPQGMASQFQSFSNSMSSMS